ncbi:MAG: hypothetical protein ACK55Z_32395 [bacterium]
MADRRRKATEKNRLVKRRAASSRLNKRVGDQRFTNIVTDDILCPYEKASKKSQSENQKKTNINENYDF